MAVVHKSTARGYKMGLTEEANKDILKDAKLIGTYCFKIFRKPNGSPLVFYESDEEDISRKDIAMLLMEMDRVKLEVLTEQKADVWMEREDSDQGKRMKQYEFYKRYANVPDEYRDKKAFSWNEVFYLNQRF